MTDKEIILEQYKIYVEMTDRISQRRSVSNTFFLTLNITVLSGASFFFKNYTQSSVTNSFDGLVLLIITACIIQTYCWWRLLKSYQQLNSAKCKVIGIMENSLPISPYCQLEWKELGEGKNPLKYVPMTTTENIVPITFGILYIILLFMIIL